MLEAQVYLVVENTALRVRFYGLADWLSEASLENPIARHIYPGAHLMRWSRGFRWADTGLIELVHGSNSHQPHGNAHFFLQYLQNP